MLVPGPEALVVWETEQLVAVIVVVETAAFQQVICHEDHLLVRVVALLFLEG